MAIKQNEVIQEEDINFNSDQRNTNKNKVNIDEIIALLKTAQLDRQSNLQKIFVTQDIFKKIKESLLVNIECMERNPSFLSRVAEFWGKLSLWKKILGGLISTVPLLILGFVAHIGFLLACGLMTIIYAGGGIILSDHYECDIIVTENLTKGILSLADTLELTIESLDIIRQKLSEEIEKFTHENEHLKESVNRLSIEITSATELAESLGKTAHEFKEQVADQRDLLNANRTELTRFKDELEKVSTLADYLGTMVQQIGTHILGDEQQKREFNKRLTLFLNNKEASFATLADRFGAAESKLALTQQELEQTSKSYQALLEEQAKHISRLERIVNTQCTQQLSDFNKTLTFLDTSSPDTLSLLVCRNPNCHQKLGRVSFFVPNTSEEHSIKLLDGTEAYSL